MSTDFWDRNQDALAKMARAGKSAAQIGAALGVSRNAVIGRCHRTGVKLTSNLKGGRPVAS